MAEYSPYHHEKEEQNIRLLNKAKALPYLDKTYIEQHPLYNNSITKAQAYAKMQGSHKRIRTEAPLVSHEVNSLYRSCSTYSDTIEEQHKKSVLKFSGKFNFLKLDHQYVVNLEQVLQHAVSKYESLSYGLQNKYSCFKDETETFFTHFIHEVKKCIREVCDVDYVTHNEKVQRRRWALAKLKEGALKLPWFDSVKSTAPPNYERRNFDHDRKQLQGKIESLWQSFEAKFGPESETAIFQNTLTVHIDSLKAICRNRDIVLGKTFKDLMNCIQMDTLKNVDNVKDCMNKVDMSRLESQMQGICKEVLQKQVEFQHTQEFKKAPKSRAESMIDELSRKLRESKEEHAKTKTEHTSAVNHMRTLEGELAAARRLGDGTAIDRVTREKEEAKRKERELEREVQRVRAELEEAKRKAEAAERDREEAKRNLEESILTSEILAEAAAEAEAAAQENLKAYKALQDAKEKEAQVQLEAVKKANETALASFQASEQEAKLQIAEADAKRQHAEHGKRIAHVELAKERKQSEEQIEALEAKASEEAAEAIKAEQKAEEERKVAETKRKAAAAAVAAQAEVEELANQAKLKVAQAEQAAKEQAAKEAERKEQEAKEAAQKEQERKEQERKKQAALKAEAARKEQEALKAEAAQKEEAARKKKETQEERERKKSEEEKEENEFEQNDLYQEPQRGKECGVHAINHVLQHPHGFFYVNPDESVKEMAKKHNIRYYCKLLRDKAAKGPEAEAILQALVTCDSTGNYSIDVLEIALQHVGFRTKKIIKANLDEELKGRNCLGVVINFEDDNAEIGYHYTAITRSYKGTWKGRDEKEYLYMDSISRNEGAQVYKMKLQLHDVLDQIISAKVGVNNNNIKALLAIYQTKQARHWKQKLFLPIEDEPVQEKPNAEEDPPAHPVTASDLNELKQMENIKDFIYVIVNLYFVACGVSEVFVYPDCPIEVPETTLIDDARIQKYIADCNLKSAKADMPCYYWDDGQKKYIWEKRKLGNTQPTHTFSHRYLIAQKDKWDKIASNVMKPLPHSGGSIAKSTGNFLKIQGMSTLNDIKKHAFKCYLVYALGKPNQASHVAEAVCVKSFFYNDDVTELTQKILKSPMTNLPFSSDAKFIIHKEEEDGKVLCLPEGDCGVALVDLDGNEIAAAIDGMKPAEGKVEEGDEESAPPKGESDRLKKMREHLRRRFELLEKIITEMGVDSVQISENMGAGLAKDQQQWGEDDKDEEDRQKFVEYLDKAITQLEKNHNTSTKTIIFRKGSDHVEFQSTDKKNIRVWGANKGNYDNDFDETIDGGGQVDGICEDLNGLHVPGLFSIITTPFEGIPNNEDNAKVPWWVPNKVQGGYSQEDIDEKVNEQENMQSKSESTLLKTVSEKVTKAATETVGAIGQFLSMFQTSSNTTTKMLEHLEKRFALLKEIISEEQVQTVHISSTMGKNEKWVSKKNKKLFLKALDHQIEELEKFCKTKNKRLHKCEDKGQQKCVDFSLASMENICVWGADIDNFNKDSTEIISGKGDTKAIMAASFGYHVPGLFSIITVPNPEGKNLNDDDNINPTPWWCHADMAALEETQKARIKEKEDALVAHIEKRFVLLKKLVQSKDQNESKVNTVEIEENMGNGKLHDAIQTKITNEIEELKTKCAQQKVTLTVHTNSLVDFSKASRKHICVWGANAQNFDKGYKESIDATTGHASRILDEKGGYHAPGLFGICITPKLDSVPDNNDSIPWWVEKHGGINGLEETMIEQYKTDQEKKIEKKKKWNKSPTPESQSESDDDDDISESELPHVTQIRKKKRKLAKLKDQATGGGGDLMAAIIQGGKKLHAVSERVPKPEPQTVQSGLQAALKDIQKHTQYDSAPGEDSDGDWSDSDFGRTYHFRRTWGNKNFRAVRPKRVFL